MFIDSYKHVIVSMICVTFMCNNLLAVGFLNSCLVKLINIIIILVQLKIIILILIILQLEIFF